MGLAPLMLWLTCLLAVRNQRILTAWDARQEDNARRAAAGLPPKPGAAAARPSPPPPRRHNPGATHPAAITGTPQITPTTARKTQPAARNSDVNHAASPEPLQPGNTPGAHGNVRPKREDKRRSNVKTFGWSGAGSNCRPSAFQALFCCRGASLDVA